MANLDRRCPQCGCALAADDTITGCNELVVVLDSHLRAAGRENVAILGVSPVRRLLHYMVSDSSPATHLAQPAIAAALAELSACLADPAREPKAEVFDRIDAMLESVTRQGDA